MKKVLVFIGLLALSTAQQTAYAQSGNTASRLKSVQTLIEKSSGARQIEASGNAQAQAAREQARAYYQQAEQAVRSGNIQQADQALLQATKQMLEAVRMADQSGVVEGKKRDDFQNRMDSVSALLDAHERIAREKGDTRSVQELRKVVNNKLAKAQQLLAQEQFEQARTTLDETYLATKTAIEKLRGGDTLVRSLNFASKEEEYHYEIDRNDTHRMLVKVLLAEKMQDANIGRLVKQFMGKADQLRSQAEKQAGRGDYAGAVSTLENSTKEVVRAIRSAGIYIPG